MAATQAGAALAADRVDLVDEDDARRVALGLVEQVADAAGADADEHLDELGPGDAEERHAGLAGHGPRHQRLARAGRPDEQHPARDPRAEGVELFGELQELDDLLELRLGLIDTGDIAKRDDRLVAEEHPRPALAEAECLVIGPLRLSHHEEDEAADDQQWQDRGEQQPEPRGIGCRGRLEDVRAEGLAGGRCGLAHVAVHVGEDRRDRDRIGGFTAGLHGQGRALLRDLGDFPGGDVAEELGIAGRLRLRAGRDPGEQQRCRPDHENEHDDAVPEELGIQKGASG